MGQVIALLSTQYEEVELKFDSSVNPDPTEKNVYDQIAEVIDQFPKHLALIEEYKGCAELARVAMSKPTPENELAAFEGLMDSIDAIANFFNLCQQIERVLPRLLTSLARSPIKTTPEQKAAIPDALSFQLAQIFNFAIAFDQTRMMRPNLSNDFSYYRRLLPKFNKHPNIRIKDDEASGLAMFTAEHIPVMRSVIKACTQAHREDPNVSAVLCILANSCNKALKTKRFASPELNLVCARAMTSAIVAYDHIEMISVFNKKTPIQVKPKHRKMKVDHISDPFDLVDLIL